MKTFKEIEAFVRKAMEEDFYVFCNFMGNITVISNSTRITIESANFGECLQIVLGGDCKYATSKQIKLNDREKELFKLLRMDVSDYEDLKVIEVFDNFFEDKVSPKTVDDLEFD